MILQSLVSFYDRMVQEPDTGMPSAGFSLQNIHFCLEITKEGKPLTIRDLRQHEGKKAFPRKVLVPKHLEERTSGVKSQFCWDNTGYTFEVSEKKDFLVFLKKKEPEFFKNLPLSILDFLENWEPEFFKTLPFSEEALDQNSVSRIEEAFTAYTLEVSKEKKKLNKKHEAFIDLHKEILSPLDCDAAQTFLAFLENWDTEDFMTLPFSEEALGQNFIFRIEGAFNFLHETPAIRDAWLEFYTPEEEGQKGQCLISGKMGEKIALTHPQLKGIPGAQSTGAALVSFNEKAYESYGKEQSLNSPVSQKSAFAYTTALNYLLDYSRHRKIQIGNATTLFWAEKASPAEDLLAYMLDPDLIDDKNYQGEHSEEDKKELEIRLRGILTAIASGRPPKEEKLDETNNHFFILGLSPNAARISVRFFHIATVRKLTETIGLHYRQMEIVKQFDNEPDFISPRKILKALAVREDTKNLSPLLSGQLMRAIFTGNPYPSPLLAAVMGRIRAEGKIDRIRTGLIKAILMRNKKMEISIMLDQENKQTGYVLGRLFSILEKLQEEALPKTNATIRDKFFSSASATPQRTFPMLLRNAQNHLSKLRKDPERTGLSIVRDKMITAIVDMLDAYPAMLSIEDQGLFTLGYYHQKKVLFTKKTTTETPEA